MIKQAFVRKSWKNESKKAIKAKKDSKNVYQVVVKPGKDRVESDLNVKPKTTILSKHESSIANSIFIHTTDYKDVKAASERKDVIAVIKKPKAVPMGNTGEIRDTPAYFPTLLQQCTIEQTRTQAGIIDSVGSSDVQVNGKGSLIIVWDFIPINKSALNIPEFQDRDGGQIYFYPNGSDAFGSHGTQVASIAGGEVAGLSKGSALALIGLSDDIFEDLSVIERLIEEFDGPTIINMSFGLEWNNVNTDLDIENIDSFMQFANQAVADIKLRFPKTLFFIAAGNETQNMCDTLGTLTYTIGNQTKNKMVIWPQFERNKETPFISVGATTVSQTSPTRNIAVYSNYGDCINFFAHGGAICGWDTDTADYRATQGTSFSSPVAASIASLLFSAYPSKTGAEILDIMNSISKDTVTGQYSEDTTAKFLELPDELKRDSNAPPAENNELPGSVLDGTVDLDKTKDSPVDEAKNEFKTAFIVVAVLLVLSLLFSISILFSKKKRNMIRIYK